MRASVGFIFFMLFLAGLALVNLKSLEGRADTQVSEPRQLSNVVWRPTNLGEMPLETDTELFIQFHDDGTVNGKSGCNLFSGSYQFTDGKFSIGPLSSTRMACIGSAGAFQFAFLDALQAAVSASRANRRLAIKDEQDAVLARFVAGQKDPDAR